MVVRAWPLELINDEPQDPKMPAEHVADLRAQCAPDAFAGFDPARFPSPPLPALAPAAAASPYPGPVGGRVGLASRRVRREQGGAIPDTADIPAQTSATGHGDRWGPIGARAAPRVRPPL